MQYCYCILLSCLCLKLLKQRSLNFIILKQLYIKYFLSYFIKKQDNNFIFMCIGFSVNLVRFHKLATTKANMYVELAIRIL